MNLSDINLAEFFAMGGYGYYIWMSYGLTAIFMIGEIILVLRHKRAILQRLVRSVRLNKAEENTKQSTPEKMQVEQ